MTATFTLCQAFTRERIKSGKGGKIINFLSKLMIFLYHLDTIIGYILWNIIIKRAEIAYLEFESYFHRLRIQFNFAPRAVHLLSAPKVARLFSSYRFYLSK